MTKQPQSESEMSSVIDDHPPKKKRKSQFVREAVDLAPERKKRKVSPRTADCLELVYEAERLSVVPAFGDH